MPTIRDVARACGLSAMTVSSVLNGKTGEASEETRARVLKAVEELGYHPNAVARGLARKRMDTIGVVASFSDRPSLMADRYFGPVFDGLVLGAQSVRQRLLIITEDNWSDMPRRTPQYCDGHCDGLIFITPTFPNEDMAPLLAAKLPLLFLGENRPELPVSVVDMDNVQAGALATTKLIEQGHRQIAYISGDQVLRSSVERGEGFRLAHQQHQLAVSEARVISGRYSELSGYQHTRTLLKLPPHERPTAIFGGDDAIAVGALRALTESGIRVPQEFSVVGINDDRIAEVSLPPLSTIRQPLRSQGIHAVEMLLEQIQDKKLALQRVLLPGEWVERATVAPAPPSSPRHLAVPAASSTHDSRK